jgi:signal transduction histidine kinase/CheY-like chemotaxis protein
LKPKHPLWLLLGAVLLVGLSPATHWAPGPGPLPAAGQSTEPRARPATILFVDDYDLNRAVWQATFSGLLERVHDDVPNAVVFTETLDVQQIEDPELLEESKRWLVQKYRDRPLDLLIGHGARSLEALLEIRDSSGRDIPILYLRADGSRPSDIRDLPVHPGVASMMLGPIEGAVATAATTLFPALRTLFLVVDNEAEADALSERYTRSLPPSVRVIPLVRPTHARVAAVARAAGPTSAVHYGLIVQDESGQVWGQHDYLTTLASMLDIPVFTAFATQLGTGTLGGPKVDPVLMGRFVGASAVELLSGVNPDALPPQTFDSWTLSLDWREFRRLGIARNRVPVGVEWVGKPEQFWEAFPRTTGAMMGLILILFGTGLNLAGSRRTIRRARDARSRLSQRLMAVVDGDRSRIARDLHDGLCQELTVVSLELYRTSPAAAARVRELVSFTRGIAYDLHASPLDRLPFFDAVRALARNVESAAAATPETDPEASNPSLTITVESSDWPADLPQAVAINLYRAVQESLQNVVRHARAHRCAIYLEGQGERCRVRVVDDGIGFQPGVAGAEGLGLVSMQERMVSVGGTFRVRAAPGKGTEVILEVPRSLEPHRVER